MEKTSELDLKQLNHLHYILIWWQRYSPWSVAILVPSSAEGRWVLGGERGAGKARQGGEGGAGEGEGAISVPVAGC